MTLWTLDTLATAAAGRLVGASPETAVGGISIDTRTLRPGDVFFAIKGVSMDGHRFVDVALDRGAAAVVVSEGEAAPAVVVPDVLRALEGVGIAARARIGADVPVVAVTGSVGKTGTKEMLRLAFGPGTHAADASYNNHWGVPLTLARMPADASAGIFEIGMNHAGEITPLTRMVRPKIAIVTTVGAAHLEFFGSVEEIADAKSEIFLGLEPGGVAIVPADNPHSARLAAAAAQAGAEIVTFAGEGADIALTAFDPVSGRADASVFGAPVSFTVHGGAHIARNALAVLGALHAAGRPLVDIAALDAWQAPKGRGRRVRLGADEDAVVLLDEAYKRQPRLHGGGDRHAARHARPAADRDPRRHARTRRHQRRSSPWTGAVAHRSGRANRAHRWAHDDASRPVPAGDHARHPRRGRRRAGCRAAGVPARRRGAREGLQRHGAGADRRGHGSAIRTGGRVGDV